VHCEADMSQVWKDVRQRYGGSGGYGWFGITASYQSLVQDLIKSQKLHCVWSEGSSENAQFGRQVFELGKKAFEFLNDKDNEFFKFEPNPAAPELPEQGQSPYLVSLNLAYSSSYFKQEIKWVEDLEYTGHVKMPETLAMALAVKCNTATEELFQELGVSEPCFTRRKAEDFDARVQKEAQAKTRLVRELLRKYASGEISEAAFRETKNFYSKVSVEDSLDLTLKSLPKISGVDKPFFAGVNQEEVVQIDFGEDLLEYVGDEIARGRTAKEVIDHLRND
jgi:hypothetical protein